MTDRFVLVTGGNGGLGRAVCCQLAAQGVRPIIVYNASQNAEQFAKEVSGVAVRVDQSNPSGVEGALNAIEGYAPMIEGVVLAASPAPDLQQIGRISVEELQKYWGAVVLGHHAVLQFVMTKSFRAQKRGSIVGVLSSAVKSDHGVQCSKLFGAYAVAKVGLMGLLSLYQGDYPWLRVRSVFPGLMETEMLKSFEPRVLEQMKAATPPVDPASVAREVVAEVLSHEP